jgi:hypothetical protein
MASFLVSTSEIRKKERKREKRKKRRNKEKETTQTSLFSQLLKYTTPRSCDLTFQKKKKRQRLPILAQNNCIGPP